MVINYNKFRCVFVLLVCVGVVGWLLFAHRLVSLQRSPKISQTTSIPAPITKNIPLRLTIPKIQVDAVIEPVGITQSGALDAPHSIMNVGWYQFGSMPGSSGSAVMDGHVDGKHGEAGIFARLYLLGRGDEIATVDTTGKTTRFTVTKTKVFAANEDTTSLFDQIEGSHLNLITCFGDWDTREQRYTKRFVVFADNIPL
jgi:sortase A